MIVGGVRNSNAGTVVTDLATFDANTINQTTVGFNGILNCSGPGCFTGFASPPGLTVNGINFTASSPFVNVTSATFYSPSPILPGDFITDSFPPGGSFDSLTITLPKAVTAFGLDFGTTNGDIASFSLSNGFSASVGTSPNFFELQFVGFISDQPFNTITFSVPSPDGWAVEEVITGATATPLPAALPLFATGFGGLGLLGWRRKRRALSLGRAGTRRV
jgi:hypothetical protein